MMNNHLKAIEDAGFAMAPGILDAPTVNSLQEAIPAAGSSQSVHRRQSIYAIRNLLDVIPEVRRLANDPAILMLVADVLGAGPFVVRALLFDKTPNANWKVTWHQDLSIAVQEKIEVKGFGPWSLKDGVWHVRPPAAVLEHMITVRIHLDACDTRNGPLHVIPGSHRHGKLDADAIETYRHQTPAIECSVPAGGALFMRPLLLHASSACQEPRHRRVIHLEYAVDDLPGELEWRR